MTKKRKKLYVGFVIYYVLLVFYIASTITQPIWDRIDPRVFGVPFSIFNVVSVQILICIGFIVFYSLDKKLHEKEKAMRERGEKIDY